MEKNLKKNVCVCVCVCLCNWLTLLYTCKYQHCKLTMKWRVSQSLSCVWLFVTPCTVAHQASLSMGFSRQEYRRGCSCLPPRDLPNPGIKLCLLCLLHCQAGSSTTWQWLRTGQILEIFYSRHSKISWQTGWEKDRIKGGLRTWSCHSLWWLI